MTAIRFYKLCMSLWGEQWRPELRKLLALHGHTYTNHSAKSLMWEWRTGNREVPVFVVDLLKAEKAARTLTKKDRTVFKRAVQGAV